jgi:SAM-dependent methyltransferase
VPKRYDRAYFDRWYRDPARRVISPAALARKVAMVVGVAEYQLGRPLRTVLDIGCGEAAWRAPLRRLRPGVAYVGVDASEYAARRFGRSRNVHLGRLASLGDVEAAAAGAPYDLIVCADVLQYLSDADVAAGLAHVASLLGGVAYVEAYTSADALEGDRRDWHARSAVDYLRLFRRAGLVHCGMHCWVNAEVAAAATTELERGRR